MSAVRDTVVALHLAAQAAELHAVEDYFYRLMQLAGIEPAEDNVPPVATQVEASRFFLRLLDTNRNLHDPYFHNSVRAYHSILAYGAYSPRRPSAPYMKHAIEECSLIILVCEKYLERLEITTAPPEEKKQKPAFHPYLSVVK